MRTQHYSETDRRIIAANQAEIDGRSWRKLADGRAMTYVEDGCCPPREYHYSVRTGRGRVFYLFLAALACMIACPAFFVLCGAVEACA